MSFFSSLFHKKETTPQQGSVEEFVTIVRVYFQASMAVQLGVTNINILNDMALFKRMLKIPTQNNKLGISERARARKVLMEDYGLSEDFCRELDGSVKHLCRTQMDIKNYYLMFQGFSAELFGVMESQMGIRFRLSLLYRSLLRKQVAKVIHRLLTQNEWKDVSTQKKAWNVKKYCEQLKFSEVWVSDFTYNIMLGAREDRRRQLRNKDKK